MPKSAEKHSGKQGGPSGGKPSCLEKMLPKPPLSEEMAAVPLTVFAYNSKGQKMTQVGVRGVDENDRSVLHAVSNIFRHFPDGRVPRIVVTDAHGPLKEFTYDEWKRQSVREGRDDIGKLPITPQAKKYARRSGLKSMLRQPKDYQNMVAAELKQSYKGFPNHDVGSSTSGGSPKKNAIKEGTGVSDVVKRVIG